MCGHDLRSEVKRQRRFSGIDAVLILAVLAILVFWWQVSSESRQNTGQVDVMQGLLPTSIPLLEATATPRPTATPLPTSTPMPIVQEMLRVRHEVVSGETLLSIAIAYDVSVEEIQRANNLSGELIRAGDELTIPVLRDSVAAQSSAATTQFEYVVLSGDTLSTIAARFGSNVEELLAANKLAAGEFIQPGDILIIPVRGAPPEVLAVASEAAPPAALTATEKESAIYIAPRLIVPEEGAVVSRNEPVIFEWTNVDLLAPNEWYVVQVLPRNLAAQSLPTAWSKQTTFRLEPSLAPAAGQVADYAWLVSVVRVLRDADGRTLIEAASPPSTVRSFRWQ